jgi:hypothetical protein
MKTAIAALLTSALLTTTITSAPARAAPAPIRIYDAVKTDFPRSVRFNATIRGDEVITNAHLSWGVDTPTCAPSADREVMSVEPATSVNLEYEWQLRESSSLAPGTRIWYQWEATDTLGRRMRSERKTVRLLDDTFTWRLIDDEGIALRLVTDDAALAKRVHGIAVDALDNAKKRYGVRITETLDIWLYPDLNAYREAMASVPAWSGGVAVPDSNTFVSQLEGEVDAGAIISWTRVLIPHELTHLIIGRRTDTCAGTYLPIWLSEGLATYAEPTLPDLAPVRVALESRRLSGLRAVAGRFPADKAHVGYVYTFGGHVVKFMVETGGATKMNQLLFAVQSGKSIDQALLAVYGYDTDGLDAAFRKSAQIAAAPYPRNAGSRPTARPTLQPFSAAPSATQTPKP